MNKIMMILRVLLSIPKTIYFNFVVFDFKTAILLPIYVDNSISIKGIYKNAITIDCSYKKTFMIKFGIGGSKAIRGKRGIIYVNHKQKGKIIFLEKQNLVQVLYYIITQEQLYLMTISQAIRIALFRVIIM